MAKLHPMTLNSLRTIPVLVERVTRQLSPEALNRRPDPERFTAKEAICHLADWDVVLIERVNGALQEDGYQMPPKDPDAIAAANNYEAMPVDQALATFKERRVEYLALLESLSEEQLARTLVHPRSGAMTLHQLASLFLNHDLYHLDQISSALP